MVREYRHVAKPPYTLGVFTTSAAQRLSLAACERRERSCSPPPQVDTPDTSLQSAPHAQGSPRGARAADRVRRGDPGSRVATSSERDGGGGARTRRDRRESCCAASHRSRALSHGVASE